MVEFPMLFRKRRPESEAVHRGSLALYRLGYQCNNHCRMCSNPAPEDVENPSVGELVRRLDFLFEEGIRQVVLTGGEPTVNPGFWPVVDRIRALGMVWDINTNGRAFRSAAFSDEAVKRGLRRAIVSLHSHDARISEEITGHADAYDGAVQGIRNLLARGVPVTINFVLLAPNAGSVVEYVEFCARTFGSVGALKIAFPSVSGRGRAWEGARLRYADVAQQIRGARKAATREGVPLSFESIPLCVLGDESAAEMGRSGWGETHYLDDVAGDRLHSIRFLEASWNVFGEACRACSALPRCPGIPLTYAREHGTGELAPFTDPAAGSATGGTR